MGFFDKYPYTNWHNVNLDWVLERVKEWGQMVEANDQAFKDLEEANASFKEYVTNYLQDLDIQAAIDDKIDRMFASGELTDYLQPYVSTTVTNWLSDHITEPEGVVIDSSLTVAGAAADAKAAGDGIRNSVWFIQQTLTEDQQEQARNNINAERKLGVIDNTPKNLFKPGTITLNTSIYGNGNTYEREGWFVSDYINIHGMGDITLRGTRINPVFNENKVVIDGAAPPISYQQDITWTVPDNVYYLRLSAKLEELDNIYVGRLTGVGFKIPDLRINPDQIDYTELFKNKNLSISGDSISTFNTYIPSGYHTYYPRGDVDSVDKTWWKKLIDATGLELCVNSSYSGMRTCSNETNKNEPFVAMSNTHISSLAKTGMTPDIIINFNGTNDWGFNYNVGSFNYNDRLANVEYSLSFATAFSIMLQRMIAAYPNAKIFTTTILRGRHSDYNNSFPYLNSNGDSIEVFNDMITKIANYLGVYVIDINKCGITPFNASTYSQDSTCTHPNAAGHDLLFRYILKEMVNCLI